MPLTRKTPPVGTILSTAKAKENLRVDASDEDDFIDGLIVAATEYCEGRVEMQFLPATWELSLDRFPSVNRGLIELCVPPVSSITSLTYVDPAGVEQSLSAADYQLDVRSQPARLLPAVDTSWPETRDQLAAVVIEFVAGYANSAAVPQTVKQAVMQLVGHWFNNREAVGQVGPEIEFGVDVLLDPVRWKR